MKKKAFVGLALAAALTMGVTPAFGAIAESDTSVDENAATLTQSNNSATGNTTLSVKTIATNITATVPVKMTVAGPAEGGSLTTPTTYALKNGSVYPISVKVRSDTAGITNAGWSLVDNADELTTTDKITLKLTPGSESQFTLKTTDSTAWTIGAKSGSDTDTACAIALAGYITKTSANAGVTSEALNLVYTIAPTTISAP